MTELLEPSAAAEIYSCSLEPRRRGPLGRLGRAALDLWCAAFGGVFDLTAAGEVVVRRRHDGVVELRVPVSGGEEAGATLTHVREQLENLDPATFREHWSIGA